MFVLLWLILLANPVMCLSHWLMPGKDVFEKEGNIEWNMIRRQSRSAEAKTNSDCQEPGELGVNYNGTTNVTSSGKPCLNWDIGVGPGHEWAEQVESNYCRNPAGALDAVWCHIRALQCSRVCSVDEGP